MNNEKEIPFGASDSELMEATYFIPQGYHAEIDGDKVIIKKGEEPVSNDLEEVDLEKAFFDWYHEEKNKDYNASILYERYGMISKKLAEYFFELGLKTQKGE